MFEIRIPRMNLSELSRRINLGGMSRKNVALLGTAAILLILAYAVHRYFSATSIPATGPYYYTTDNGRSFISSRRIHIPPFDLGGKKAFEAGVFVDAHGKPYVAYVYTYLLAGQAILAGLPKVDGQKVDNDSMRMQASQYCLVRKPGHRKWVPWNSHEGQQIVNVRDPDTGQPAKLYDYLPCSKAERGVPHAGLMQTRCLRYRRCQGRLNLGDGFILRPNRIYRYEYWIKRFRPQSLFQFWGQRIKNGLYLRLKGRDIFTGGFEDTGPVDLKIIMHQHMAHPRNSPPRHFRMRLPQSFRPPPSRLAENLDMSQNMRLNKFIAYKILHRGRCTLHNLGNRIENVLQQQTRWPHSGTASFITCSRKRGRRPSASSTSTGTPSRSCRSNTSSP